MIGDLSRTRYEIFPPKSSHTTPSGHVRSGLFTIPKPLLRFLGHCSMVNMASYGLDTHRVSPLTQEVNVKRFLLSFSERMWE